MHSFMMVFAFSRFLTSFLNTASPLSAIRHPFQLFRVSVSVHDNLRRSLVEFAEIVSGEFDGDRSDVFFKALQFGGSWNGNNPGLLHKKPGERDLSGAR